MKNHGEFQYVAGTKHVNFYQWNSCGFMDFVE